MTQGDVASPGVTPGRLSLGRTLSCRGKWEPPQAEGEGELSLWPWEEPSQILTGASPEQPRTQPTCKVFAGRHRRERRRGPRFTREETELPHLTCWRRVGIQALPCVTGVPKSGL